MTVMASIVAALAVWKLCEYISWQSTYHWRKYDYINDAKVEGGGYSVKLKSCTGWWNEIGHTSTVVTLTTRYRVGDIVQGWGKAEVYRPDPTGAWVMYFDENYQYCPTRLIYGHFRVSKIGIDRYESLRNVPY